MMDMQTGTRKRLNDEIASGTMDSVEAARQMQVETALLPMIIAQTLAEGDAKKKLADAIARLRVAYANDNDEARRNTALRQLESQRDSLEYTKREIALQGTNQSTVDEQLAQLRAQQELKRAGVDTTSAEGKAWIDNETALVRFNQQLEQTRAAKDELVGGFNTILNDIESSGDALGDLQKQAIKLGVNNPIQNFLFGTKAPTFGSVGGVAGQMFGGLSNIFDVGGIFSFIHHKGGMAGTSNDNTILPINVVRYAPRYHTGHDPLGPNEVAAVLDRRERVLSPSETLAYNAGQRAVGNPSPASNAPSENHFHLEGAVITSDLLRDMNSIGRVSGNRAVRMARDQMSDWQETNYYERG
jgi:hypothetical protein